MRKIILMAIASFSFLGMSTFAQALNCQQVRQLSALYLKYHYSFDSFDDELSDRTLANFVKFYDPGKLYFYKQDVEKFEKSYAKTIDDSIKKGDCKPINEIVNVFLQRFEERHKLVPNLIKAKQDFSIDESLSLDRKKIGYASDSNALTERWRKRIKFQLLQLKTSLGDLEKAREKVHKRYDLVVKRQNEQTIDQVYSAFLNAFSSGLDPHSQYLAAEELEDFRIDTKLSLEGIGAVLRPEDGFTIIQSLVTGGAAAKTSKLKVDDKIIAVAQGPGEPVDVIDMQLREVVKLIRGTAGTEVRLTVLRNEGSKTDKLVVPVIREKIQLKDRVAKSRIEEVEILQASGKGAAQKMKIGVLDLPSFYVDFEGMHQKRDKYRSSFFDVQKELQALKKQNVDAVVLDLRSNGGGSLEESIKIAGLFFDSGPVVQIKDMDGRTRAHSDPNKGTEYAGPLLLMINRQSASASEILAGAIQDYDRGLIVGDSHSFGKGTVQNLNDIGDSLGAVKITISKFYRPSGGTTQLDGVSSDIVLPSIVDELEIGEKHYDYALKFDQIEKSKFSAFNLTKPYVKELAKISEARVAKDDGFVKVREEIKKYKEGEKDRYMVSLKEKTAKEIKAEKQQEALAKKEKEEKRAGADDDEPNLANDVGLQETLKIAADYVQLLGKKQPGIVSIPSLVAPALANIKKQKPANGKVPKPDVKTP